MGPVRILDAVHTVIGSNPMHPFSNRDADNKQGDNAPEQNEATRKKLDHTAHVTPAHPHTVK